MKGSLFYFFLTAILSIIFLYTRSYFLIIALVLIALLVYKKYGPIFLMCLIFTGTFFNFYRVNEKPFSQIGNVQQTYDVKTVKEKYLIITSNKVRYLMYYDEMNFEIKDKIIVKGECKEIENDLELDTFEFADYLKNQRVFYEIVPYSIEKIETNNSLSTNIKKALTSKLNGESLAMTNMLIFNDKYASIDNYNNLIDINAVHLFVVSGFHISFFFTLILKLFKKNEDIGKIVALIVCGAYIFLLDFSLSATRAFISLFLFQFFKDYLNKLDCIAIPGLLFMLIEPLCVFNYSFILTFIMVSTIAFTSTFLRKYNKIAQTFMLSGICFLVMIPIQLIINYKINFISLLTNILLSYVVMIIFILCLLGIILSIFNGNIFGVIYGKFNQFIDYLTTLNTSIVFGNMNIVLVILYYLICIVLFYTLEKGSFKKSFISGFMILLIMIGLYNRSLFMFYQQVTFLNVYQGDCCIIQDSNNGKVMLIDTGGLRYYDIAEKKIMPYLNYQGIRKIDIVLITHHDYDHYGALEKLQQLIQIDLVIEDPSIEEVNLGKIHFENLNKYYTEDSIKNDKSIVLYANICSLNFMFTGDMTAKIEEQIAKNNKDIDLDVLKVAHHGSSSSSCELFLDTFKPEYAVISTGKNFYGHPNEKVIERLKKHGIKVYRTDKNGTTRIKGKIFNKWFIESAK